MPEESELITKIALPLLLLLPLSGFSRVRLFATPWTAAHQAPPSMGLPRQEYWNGVPLPSLGLCKREIPDVEKYNGKEQIDVLGHHYFFHSFVCVCVFSLVLGTHNLSLYNGRL